MVFVFRTVGEAVDLIRGLNSALRDYDLRIGWHKSGVMADSELIVRKIRDGIKAIYTDIDFPSVQKGYKYLGCIVQWKARSTLAMIREASDRVKKKARNYSFRFGSLRNDLAIGCFPSFRLLSK